MNMKTKGTEMFLVDEDSGGFSVVKIGCPTGISGLGGSKTQIDTTCLDSDEQEYEGGFGQPGTVTTNINFDPRKTSHRRLFELDESGDHRTFIIGLSDGTSVPTVDTNGNVTLPTDRTFMSFDGYVSDYPFDIATNSVYKTAMQIQRSGKRTLSYKAS